jgi:hypothetical protein
MGNPAYDARREAEQAEAEQRTAAALAGKAALEAVVDFLNGRASVSISPSGLNGSTSIRFYRDNPRKE